jgi:arylsulfatase A-like enzyme
MFSHVGLTDPNCSIPFIIKAPGITAGRRIDGFVSQVDMMPTLLDLLGIEYRPPYAFDGVSLLPNIKGERDFIPPSACELGEAPADPSRNHEGAERKAALVVENTYQKQRAIRTNRWKYIKKIDDHPSMPARQLYDLMFDPGEARNIADETTNITKPLDDAMEAWINALCKKHGTTDPQPRFPLTLREGFTYQIRQMYGKFDKDQVFF